jgi:hypothetical protein
MGGHFEITAKASWEGQETETLHSFDIATPTLASRVLNTLRVKNLENKHITVNLDKAEYIPGDVAQILVMVRIS